MAKKRKKQSRTSQEHLEPKVSKVKCRVKTASGKLCQRLRDSCIYKSHR